MRRSILFLTFILLSCGIMCSQVSRFLSPMMNIEGVFKKTYDGVEKGTPFVLQKIVKLKRSSQQVRVLKSPAPDRLMLGNDCLLISTGMLPSMPGQRNYWIRLISCR